MSDVVRKTERDGKRYFRFIAGAVFSGLLMVSIFIASGLANHREAVEVEVTDAVEESSHGRNIVLSATGYIVPHHRIDVNSKVTGRIAWIGVEKGDRVHEGQILVRLEDQEFRAQVQQATGAVLAAEAHVQALKSGSRPEEVHRELALVKEAEANLANEELNLGRIKELFSQNLVSRQQLDDATASYQSAKARKDSSEQSYRLALLGPRSELIAEAEADLATAHGQLAYARSQLEAATIRAPVSGTILERTAERGELITAQFASSPSNGGPRGSVVALANLEDIQVELDISQDDFVKLKQAKDVVVATDAYPDKAYAGSVREIAPEANRQKATIQVRVQILNPDSFLRPEMNANVAFLSGAQDGKSSESVLVPESSVRTIDKRRIVYGIVNGTAVEREIQILGMRSNGYLITGIARGSQVAVDPPSGLKAGDKIVPKQENR